MSIKKSYRERKRAYTKKWRAEHMEQIAKQQNARNRKIRQDILELLGNKCLICGESDWRCLQIDHINGNGRKERKQYGYRGSSSYYYRIREKVLAGSKDYQLLCANHNMIKQHEMKEWNQKYDH